MSVIGGDPDRVTAAADALDRLVARVAAARRRAALGSTRAGASWHGAASAQFERTVATPTTRSRTSEVRLEALAAALRRHAAQVREAQAEERALCLRRDDLRRHLLHVESVGTVSAAAQERIRQEIGLLDRRLDDLVESVRVARHRFRVEASQHRPARRRLAPSPPGRMRTGPVARLAPCPPHKMRTGPVGRIAASPPHRMRTGPVARLEPFPWHKNHPWGTPQTVTGVVTAI